jgi:hypothetical protein
MTGPDRLDSLAFSGCLAYLDSDVPPGMTLADWRSRRTGPPSLDSQTAARGAAGPVLAPLTIDASPGTRASVFLGALIEANPPGAIQARSDDLLRQAVTVVCAVERRPTVWDVYRMLSPGDASYRDWALTRLDQMPYPPGHPARQRRDAKVRGVWLRGPLTYKEAGTERSPEEVVSVAAGSRADSSPEAA